MQVSAGVNVPVGPHKTPAPRWPLLLGSVPLAPVLLVLILVAGCRTPLEPPPDRSDRDLDFVLDRLDRCPDQPENYNGNQDADGCPDQDIILVGDEGGVLTLAAPIAFLAGSAELEPGAQVVIGNLARVMAKSPQLQVRVDAHVFGASSAAANLKLSELRAKAVRDALIAEGADGARLHAGPRGDTRPINKESTPEAKAQNERIELVVIKR